MAVVEVEILRVVLEEATQTPVVLLREKDGHYILPIVIGHAEAQAILIALQGMQVERPLTHDLLKTMIETLGGTVERVVIHRLHHNTFYARILVRQGEVLYSVDARPSDSMALALRVQCPIFVARTVLEQAGTPADEPVEF